MIEKVVAYDEQLLCSVQTVSSRLNPGTSDRVGAVSSQADAFASQLSHDRSCVEEGMTMLDSSFN